MPSDEDAMAIGSTSDESRTKVRCTACGAKNGGGALCRICGTMLPGADERRRVGNGDGTFADLVERESGEWGDHAEGRTSAEARSRRPAELPTVNPKDWAAVIRGEAAAVGAAGATARRDGRPGRSRGGWAPVLVVAVLAVLAVVVGAVAFLGRRDPKGVADRARLVAAMPVTAGTDHTYAQTSLDTAAQAGGALDVGSGVASGCSQFRALAGARGSASAVEHVAQDRTASAFDLHVVTMANVDDAHALYEAATTGAAGGCLVPDATAQPGTAPRAGDEAAAFVLSGADHGRADAAIMRTGRTVVVFVGSAGSGSSAPFPTEVTEGVLADLAGQLAS